MVLSLFCSSVQEYYRILERPGLAFFFLIRCPHCSEALGPDGWGYRRILAFFVRRCRCRLCHARFTILPIFVAPAKWYGYSDIERGISFITGSSASSLNGAILEWEALRENRRDEGIFLGPSGSSLLRWWKEVDQNPPTRSWLEFAFSEIRLLIPDFGLGLPLPPRVPSFDVPESLLLEEPPGPKSPESGSSLKGTTFHRPDGAKKVFETIRLLGSAILGTLASIWNAPLFGVGTWFLEGRFEHRCLAMADLAGRVIPGQSPSLAVTSTGSFGYPPEPYPPP